MAEDKPVDHLAEIEALAKQLSRASPSGVEEIAGQISEHVSAVRGERDAPAPAADPVLPAA